MNRKDEGECTFKMFVTPGYSDCPLTPGISKCSFLCVAFLYCMCLWCIMWDSWLYNFKCSQIEPSAICKYAAFNDKQVTSRLLKRAWCPEKLKGVWKKIKHTAIQFLWTASLTCEGEKLHWKDISMWTLVHNGEIDIYCICLKNSTQGRLSKVRKEGWEYGCMGMSTCVSMRTWA